MHLEIINTRPQNSNQKNNLCSSYLKYLFTENLRMINQVMKSCEASGDIRKRYKICHAPKVSTGCFECSVCLCLKTRSTVDSSFKKIQDKYNV